MKRNRNRSMNQFNDLIFMVLYIFCLVNIKENIYFPVFLLIVIISIFFVIKYLNLKNRMHLSASVLKQYLINQRDTFVNSLNHDLRIPVIAQLRILELINKNLKNNLDEAQKDMLCQAELSCRNILNLISLLINTYNTENNAGKLIYQKFNLTDIIVSCIKELKNEAQEKKISFEYETNSNNLSVYADKEDIKKVILNMLLSSLINSESNCQIKIITEQLAKKIKFSVIGKNENISSNTNSNFAAIGQSTRLYFCKKIIEIHNGHFLPDYKTPNVFSFELPQ